MFAHIKLLIVDEISTTDLKFLEMMDAALRRVTGMDALCGGISMMLVGDWLQQQPVSGIAAFVTDRELLGRESRQASTDKNLFRLRGSQVYQAINHVVILKENERHRSDPRWAAILNRWRYGTYNEDDIAYVNAKCYRRSWEVSDSTISFSPVIVTSNLLRTAFNKSGIHNFCNIHQEVCHRWYARTFRSRNPLSVAQQTSLRCLRDDKTSGMPIVSEMAIGMPVQCTKNLSRSLKLANGTLGHVIGIQWPRNRNITRSRGANCDYDVCEYDGLPDYVLIKLIDFAQEALIPGFAPGVVPVRPTLVKQVKIHIADDRQFTVNIEQVPLIPAFSLTSDKCQGLTVDRMILGPLRHDSRRLPQRTSFYVAMTRVRTMANLFLMEPLTSLYLKYFKPSPVAIAEMARLAAEDATS